jgi:hypothetical protein
MVKIQVSLMVELSAGDCQSFVDFDKVIGFYRASDGNSRNAIITRGQARLQMIKSIKEVKADLLTEHLAVQGFDKLRKITRGEEPATPKIVRLRTFSLSTLPFPIIHTTF